MELNSNRGQMTSTTGAPVRAGTCVCGAPVADHFDSHNRSLDCTAARRRWQDRLAKERSHVDLLVMAIATVMSARLGLHPKTNPIVDSLPAQLQDDVRLLARMVLSCLDPDRRRDARSQAIARGLEEYRQWLGQLELSDKSRRQLRLVFEGVLNEFTAVLNGLATVDESRPLAEVIDFPTSDSGAHADGYRDSGESEVQ